MLCLGIETSCDETAIALMQNKRLIKERIASQENMHAVFGGVVPELASRKHLQALPLLFDEFFSLDKYEAKKLDFVAVTRGPGLLGSILVGLGMAKGLVLATGAKLIGINHLTAHMLASGVEQELSFPALGVLISGGHTQLYFISSCVDFRVLGRTLDDAVGEAFDKTAKLLNLPYPGGKYIDQLAAFEEPNKTLFPCPYLDNTNLDFSFSGLKTAVANYIRKNPWLRFQQMQTVPDLDEIIPNCPYLSKVCASFNWSVAKALYVKTKRALEREKRVSSLMVAGGVASNSMIRGILQDLAYEYSVPLIIPSSGLCTDNATMIAYTGALLFEKGYYHDLNLEAIPRGKPIPWDYNQFTP